MVMDIVQKRILFVLLLGMVLSTCSPILVREADTPEQALVPVRFSYPRFLDDMNLSSLAEAIRRNLEYLNRVSPDRTFRYGQEEFSPPHVLATQQAFLDLISQNPTSEKLDKWVRKHFLIYRATGRGENSRVLFTGYFEPTYEASLTPDQDFKYPLYRRPDDLIDIDLSLFNSKYRGEMLYARIQGNKALPYYSRHEIDLQEALGGRGLEIAWLKNPIDRAFLQIQGSGRLKLPGGNMVRVGYAAKNGQPYRPMGRYLLEKELLNKDNMSMQAIREVLSQRPDFVDEVLDYNPSYVFFRLMGDDPIVGNIQVPLTPGRSVALDSRLFPKGALCFISSRKPVLSDQNEITGWTDFSRFVMNQDTGGAIRGAGRADIFWGNDTYAELAAGHMRHEGDLYILIKR